MSVVSELRPLRVAMLTGSVSRAGGGTCEVIQALAQSLAATHGAEVRVYGTRDEHTVDDLSKWGSVPILATPSHGPKHFGFSPGMTHAVLDAPVDLVHVHGLWMHCSVIAQRWKHKTGGPTMVSPHGMLDRWALHRRPMKTVALMSYEGGHLRKAGCIHALNAAEHDAIRAAGLTNPVCIVGNGVAAPSADASPRPDWRSRLPDNSRVLLHLGRVHPKKGLVGLLRALAILRTRRRLGNWHFAIAGWDQGSHEAELVSLAGELGIGDRVHAVGPQFGACRDATYRAADAFVLPSLSEGLPMAVLEAWAQGLPVLMTEHCNLPEGFASGAAIRIDTEPERMAAQLAPVFQLAPETLGAIGQRGRALVSERFSWKSKAAAMASVYRWLLGHGAMPDCVEEWKPRSFDATA